MKYMGSKNRIAKNILPIILKNRLPNQYYVEPFVGGANLIDKVDGLRIGSDNNKYLIAMWKALLDGYDPPKEISREMYNKYRDLYLNNKTKDIEHIIGYIGFNGSYNGRFFDGGYAGILKDKTGKILRNYPVEAYNNVMKQITKLNGVIFKNCSYEQLEIPPNSIIYCDPPYAKTKKYTTSKNFNYINFWEWVREKAKEGHQIFISEYSAPADFKCIWEKEISSSLTQNTGSKKGIEKLFIPEYNFNSFISLEDEWDF